MNSTLFSELVAIWRFVAKVSVHPLKYQTLTDYIPRLSSIDNVG